MCDRCTNILMHFTTSSVIVVPTVGFIASKSMYSPFISIAGPFTRWSPTNEYLVMLMIRAHTNIFTSFTYQFRRFNWNHIFFVVSSKWFCAIFVCRNAKRIVMAEPHISRPQAFKNLKPQQNALNIPANDTHRKLSVKEKEMRFSALNWNQIHEMNAKITTTRRKKKTKKNVGFNSFVGTVSCAPFVFTSLRFVVINKNGNKTKWKPRARERELKRKKRIFLRCLMYRCSSSPRDPFFPTVDRMWMLHFLLLLLLLLFVFSFRFSSEKKSIFIFRLNAFCLQKTTGYGSRVYTLYTTLCIIYILGSALCNKSVYKHTQTRTNSTHRKHTHTQTAAEGAP